MTMNTDQELMRYMEAEEMAFAKPNVGRMSNAIRQYNPKTKRNDVLVKLASGGAFNIGGEDLPQPEVMTTAPEKPLDMRVQDVKDYNAQFDNKLSYAERRANLEAAGMDREAIMAAGILPPEQGPVQAEGTVQPSRPDLSENEITEILANGGGLIGRELDPSMREDGFVQLTEFLLQNAVEGRRQELVEHGYETDALMTALPLFIRKMARRSNTKDGQSIKLTEHEIEQILQSEMRELRTISETLADGVFGYRNIGGIGVGDFMTAGVMDIQEGYRMYMGSINPDGSSNSNIERILGLVVMSAGVAEATGVGYGIGKIIKASVPKLRAGLTTVGNRLNQPGEMPTVSSFGVGEFAPGQAPQKLIVDPVLEAAGKEMAASVENVTLGAPTDIPLVSQLAPEYRVTLQGVEPGGTGKQSFIKKDMTPSNFTQMSSNLTQLGEEFTNPLASEETYALMMGKVQNSVEVPKPPSWMIEHSNNIEKWSSWFRGLTPDQLKAADEGLSIQKDFQDAYASGAGPELTGQLMLWSILSRRLSAFPHEAGYIELAEAATPFIKKAANGTWTDADTAEWLKVVPQAIPAGTPGKSGTSNANDFGKVFLKKMAAVDENGVSALTRLHELIANPDMSSTEIRRAYYGLAQDTGIANKILSFALLVSGRNDVVVLDRIQINRMWAGGDKIYDDVYTQFEGAQGLAQYEALERSLAQTVPQMYQAAGRGDVGSVGRYHWESWVLSSGQVVSHPTLEGVVKAGAPKDGEKISPTASVPVSEGRFHTKFSGVQYEKLPNGGNRFIYNTSDGQPFQFTKQQLDDMFKEVFSKKSGVLPNDFPGVKAFEGGSIPWFEFKGVDRGKLDEFIRNTGKPITE